MRLTHEIYLERVKKINPHIKIVTTYKGMGKPISYVCPICKEEQTISQANALTFYKIKGCRNCNYERFKNLKRPRKPSKYNHDTYLKAVHQINPNIEVLSTFNGLNKPISYRCPVCKKQIDVKNALGLLTPTKCCSECFLVLSGVKRSEQTKSKAKNILSEFKNLIIENESHECIHLRCNICHHTFNPPYSKIVKKYQEGVFNGCSRCHNEKKRQELKSTGNKDNKTYKRFLLFLEEGNYSWLNETKYLTTQTRVDLSCNVCGEEWNTEVKYCNAGKSDCKCCSGYKLNEYYMKKYLKENRPNIQLLKFNHKEKSVFKCLECGRVFPMTNNQMRQRGKCNHKNNNVMANEK